MKVLDEKKKVSSFQELKILSASPTALYTLDLGLNSDMQCTLVWQNTEKGLPWWSRG